MPNKTILITGSSGFIGTHLTKAAIARGYNIVEFDIKEHMDILDRNQLSAAMYGCDAVIHLAAEVAPQKQFGKNLSHNYEVNITGFLNVIEMARKLGIKRFVYASSSAVHGKFAHIFGELQESGIIDYTKEDNYYGKTKMANEMIAGSYHDAYGIDTIGLRIISAYGPGDLERKDGGSIIANLIKQKIETGVIEVFGNGTAVRDFIHVDDCAFMILDLLEKAPNGIYNIGRGKPVSINDVTKILGGEVTYKPNPNSYSYHWVVADMKKTLRTIGARDTISPEKGIKEMLQHYQQQKIAIPLRQETKTKSKSVN